MASNTFTKGYSDGAGLTEAMLDTAYQTLQQDISNTALMTTGSASGQALVSNGSGIAASFQTISDPQGPFALRNYGLKATVATGVMTISLKTKALATPTGTDIVDFNYSTNGTTSASYNSVQITAATTLPLNASATLGGVGTSTQNIYVFGYYNTSTASVKLAVSRSNNFDNGTPVTLTALSSSSDVAGTLYATAALTVMPRLLGTIVAAQSSAGAWQTPTKVNITNNAASSPFELNRTRTTSSARIGQVVISASSGSFSTTNSASTDVTNLSVNLTTTGRPVRVELVACTSTGTSYVGSFVTGTIGTSWGSTLRIVRGTSTIGLAAIGHTINTAASVTNPSLKVPPSFTCVDAPASGTYTYKLQAQKGSATGVQVQDCKLVAYEI